jgi:hypothetical protein
MSRRPGWARLAITAPVVVAHVLLPVFLLGQMPGASREGPMAWLSLFLVAAGFFPFILLAGAWSWFGRVPRALLAALFVAIAGWTRPHGLGGALTAGIGSFDLLLSIALGGLFGALALFALRGRALRDPALDLAFPLRGGVFHVGQGGASRAVNYHFAHPSQRYALDIVMLNGAGARARGLYPAQLERYAIWRAEVVSPCDGVVAAAVDGLADRPPPERDPAHPAGNHIAIESAGATIYLAHLMQGSLLVRAGDRVRAGQPLGRVGNSGNTTEPHLHVHAERGPYPGRFSGRPGLPIRFGGRFLVRNDRVRAVAPR